MGILVPFSCFSQVLSMAGRCRGTLLRVVQPQKQNFSKALRSAIELDELYCATKSFQNWSICFYAHNLRQRPPFCFAQAYRTSTYIQLQLPVPLWYLPYEYVGTNY